METLEEVQPDVQLGGRILLQNMESPTFTEPLLIIASYTKMSPLDSTLQESLPVGHALPVWGEGRNPPTAKAKEFVQDLFEKGQKTKPVPAADAVIMMQLKTDETGKRVFDETTFLDEDQIKTLFGTISRNLKKGESDPKEPTKKGRKKSRH